ncbi:unnamed protein product [Rotaria sp. Silwood1]|nr:unnamed protein product [Rotaria sp. Silwood1]CAF1243385.1 unnamed protein product [Rotaria sp. Silwood1]CAF3501658.1 unnamed protein product [Rotaria sp. Silwood1]CAF4543188.1 unnamed protein product [Rotaria sp. Silwood1]
MLENINWKINEDDEHQQEESSSRHLLIALEDLLKRSHNSPIHISKIKYQSKSVDDLLINRQNIYKQTSTVNDNNNNISKTILPELDLSGIGSYEENNEYDLEIQRSRSAPVSPTKIYDKELGAFIDCEQHQSITDSFVYNIDLSDQNENIHQPNSRLAIFFDDDYLPEETNYEPSISLIHSSLISNCLTITEENEEELEQLTRDDDEEQQQQQENLIEEINENSISITTLHNDNNQTDTYENDNQINKNETQDMNNRSVIFLDKRENNIERLSTIYEAPSPQPEIEDELNNDTDDKLIVYDIAKIDISTKSSIIHSNQEFDTSNSLFHLSPVVERNHINSCYTDAFFKPCPNFTNNLSASRLCGTTTMNTSKVHNPSSLLFTSLLTTTNDENSCSLPVINGQIISSLLSPKQQSSSRSSPMLFSTPTDDQSKSIMDNNKLSSSQHIKMMKVIQSSSSSLSDFISPILKSPLQTTSYYDDILNVRHSLTDCSLINQTSSLINENNSTKNQIFDNHERKPLSTRRILTNGLLLSHSFSNPTPRRVQDSLVSNHNNNNYSIKQKTEEKLLSDSSSSSSSSELLSLSDEKLFSRSVFVHQQEQNISQQRKASSLKSIHITTSPQPSSKILYPIDFNANNLDLSWHQKRSSHTHKVPTSDSGIVIDTHPTPKSSSEDDDNNGVINTNQIKQYEINYQKILTDLTILKKNIVNIESRLNEVMRELDIEQALIEGEHELVFKQILNASESDQQKIRQLNKNLQQLIERIMAEKNSMRKEIDYTHQNLLLFEHELKILERQCRPSDEKILKKKEMIAVTRKKIEDLEFQFMELETRCESELEKAEEHFQTEQKLVTQNAQMRQNTLRDLDHQQYIALHQALMEKEKLEREKQKLKLFFKQKKLEANELEKRIYDTWSNINGTSRTVYQSLPIYRYGSLNHPDGLSSPKMEKKDNHQGNSNEIKDMMTNVKLEKVTIPEQQLPESHNETIKRIGLEEKLTDNIQKIDYQVKLREKNRLQERPLTRYLPVRSVDFDLRAHIEGAGHLLNSPHISLTSTSCRGYLHKMGGTKFKTWNRRWFVFDRQRRSVFYYQDRNETKLRGRIYFQSIVEVYVDHLQSISLRPPEPREATFIVKTIERPYYLVAPTVELMRLWVDVIITGAEGNTFAGV